MCRCLRRTALALVIGVALVGGTAGCARNEFADRTAVVTIAGKAADYDVASCGLDGQTLFVVARADDGAVVQAVVGLADDDATGIPASSGITVDRDPTTETSRVAAFGAESWERRGKAGTPPGTVRSARLRGSRIQLAATAVAVDAQDRPVDRAEPVYLSFDARCDETD
jgi:hypothetical protein